MKHFSHSRICSYLITIALILSCMLIPSKTTHAAEEEITLSGIAHVQTFGNVNGSYQNGVLTLGTRGKAKRVESINIKMQNNTGYDGTLEYRVHRQTFGWTDWVKAGSPAGTVGQAKRLEAIEMRLTGELAEHYDVLYMVHIQSYGDNQGWVANGALAGTTGEAKRLEEVKVKIVPKNKNQTPVLAYRVHRQTYGWEKTWTTNGGVSGTVGQSKRLEGITIHLQNNSYDGGIEYKTHVQSYGWMDWVQNGQMSGTSGQAKRLEAIQIRLTGELADKYDIYYRVHAQSFGWLGWAKNGEYAGTVGISKRLEAIQIVMVTKGASINTSYGGIQSDRTKALMDSSDLPQPIKLVKENGQYVVYLPIDDGTTRRVTGMNLNLASKHNYYKNETFEQAMMADAVAKMYAEDIMAAPSLKTDLARVNAAAQVAAYYSSGCKYGSDAKGHYRSPYGVFIDNVYTCAGSTRACGRILDYMGYSWTHANENQNTHQWCELTMDGKKGYADGMAGIADYGDARTGLQSNGFIIMDEFSVLDSGN